MASFVYRSGPGSSSALQRVDRGGELLQNTVEVPFSSGLCSEDAFD